MAITCPNCNFAGNPSDAEACRLCNSPLLDRQASQSTPQSNQEGNQTQLNPPTGVQTRIPVTPDAEYEVSSGALLGRITWIETTTENIVFNWYRFLSQLVLFLLFLPPLIAIFAMSFVLWISLAILGFRALSRDISPFNVANTINSLGILLAVIFPRIPQRNQVPTVRLTIQNSEGERPVLIKGELVSGTFRRGDEVELDGRWQNGTLIMQRGYNRTLQTALELRRDYWRIIFAGLLGLIVLLGALFLVNYR